MSWNYELDLTPDYQTAKKEKSPPIREISELISNRLSNIIMPPILAELRDEFVVKFDELKNKKEPPTTEDFNVLMDDFYNWADSCRMWVKTF